MSTTVLSFIIPAYNEEVNLRTTLAKIRQFVPSKFSYEVIVVDHGSLDRTVAVAEKAGVAVFVRPDTTIAGLRNYGVSQSSGEILIFLDADISLTHDWAKYIGNVIAELQSGSPLFTGSWYCVPDTPTWIEKYWFEPLQKLNNTHINSGHMILSREYFDRLNGFDESLETGEDYDISMRAKAAGMRLVDNHDLKVIHEGYPKDLSAFMRREYWHGKGDGGSITAVLGSKVAVLALFFIVFHVCLILSLLLSAPVILPLIAILGIALLCFTAAFVKYRNESVYTLLVNSLIYYGYFLARSGSLLQSFFPRGLKKRQR